MRHGHSQRFASRFLNQKVRFKLLFTKQVMNHLSMSYLVKWPKKADEREAARTCAEFLANRIKKSWQLHLQNVMPQREFIVNMDLFDDTLYDLPLNTVAVSFWQLK